MTDINRRNLLKYGALAAPGLLLPGAAMAGMATPPPPPKLGKKMLMIFLRGANDGLNTVIPVQDYYSNPAMTNGIRGQDLTLPESSLLAVPGVAAGVAKVHPRLQPLIDVMNAGGKVAFLPAVGSRDSSRSHFTEMQIFETAKQASANSLARDGWIARLAGRRLGGVPAPRGVSMSRRMQTFFASAQSSEILTHMNSLYGYDRAPDDTDQNSTAGISLAFKMHGNTMPAMLRGSVPGIAGLPGAFAQTHTSSLVRDTGSWMLSSLNAVASMPPAGALHNKQRFPATVGEISDVADPALESTVQVAQWLRDLEQAMHLLKYTSTDVVGVELGGFDTHVNQIPTHQRLLGALAFGMRSVFQDTPANIDLLTMVVSEFGRQIVQNGNPQPGTDHGIGGCFIAMGSGVRSGVYNMGISGFGHAWKPLADTASGNVPVSNPYWNAVVPAASWFALVRELLSKHFGASQADLDYILRTGSRRDLADRYTWEINYLV